MKYLLQIFIPLFLLPLSSFAYDINPSGFSLYSGGEFYVLTDGVFSADQNIEVRFEGGGNTASLKPYGGVDVRLYQIPKPLDFLAAQKNLHRPNVKANESGEGLANVLSYLWDSWYKKTRLAWQRIFSPEIRATAVQQVPELQQTAAHTYQTKFKNELQFSPLKGYELVGSFRYPIWQAKVNQPQKSTVLEGSSSNFIETKEGNVILPLGKRKPGLYLVEAMIGTYRATTLVFVSNSILVTKVSHQQAFVWTVNGQTGESYAGTKIMLTDGVGILDKGTANSEGVFTTKRSIPERSFALGEDKEGGVSVSENFFYDSEVLQSKIYVFTDRPLYQPGDTVNVRAFGRELKRVGDTEVWNSLAGKSASISVVDATGLTLFTKPMDWDGAHGGDAQLKLPDAAITGGYTLKLNVLNEVYTAAFRVARFTKPHFDSRIVFDKPAYKVGEAVKGKVILTYPSGQPVVSADVDLQLRAEQMSMFEGSYSYTRAMAVELSKKSYKTDSRGQISFTFPPATKPSRYIATSRSLDQGAFRVLSKKEVLIEGYLETFVLSSEYSSTQPGVPVKMSYVRQGSETDGLQALAKWQAIRLEDRTTVSGKVQAADRGEFEMKLEKPGHYVVRVVDINGVTRGTRSHVVLGDGLKSVTGQVEILADKESYSKGDTAQLLLTFPFKAEEALLTLERNDVAAFGRLSGRGDWYSAKRLNEFQWLVQVEIVEKYSPNIIFSVAYARNNEFGFQNKGLVVKKPMIDIRFKADKESYAPGDKVVVQVETSVQGKPLSALVAVGVVDEMIYVLQPEIAPPIGDFFHYQRRNQVRTTSSLSFYSFNPATSNIVVERPAAAADRDMKLMQERWRRDAQDTAFWNGRLKTGKDGKAQFEFTMPDALTRWRITGRAIALGEGHLSQVGESRSFLVSAKDFYLKWTGPVRFRAGDQPRPALVAMNTTAQDVESEIVLQGSNDYRFAQKMKMKPGANTIILDSSPLDTQTVSAEIKVDGKTVDALQFELDFIAGGWVERQSQAVVLTQASTLKIPGEAKNVRLKILPVAGFQFMRVVDDLLEYPWGCVEQTSSRLIPLTMAVKALESFGGTSNITLQLRDRIANERRRLVAMAGPSAIFTWWGDQTGENLLLTAHAYYADSRASALLGIQVPQENWEHLLDIYSKSKTTLYFDRAYTLWVLSKLGLPVGEQAKTLLSEMQNLKTKNPIQAWPTNSSIFIDNPADDPALALLILGSVAHKANLPLSVKVKAELNGLANLVSDSPGYSAAALLYKVESKLPVDAVGEADKILGRVRFETPTIDRSMTLSFIEQALPQAISIKETLKAISIGNSWQPDVKSSVLSFSLKKSVKKGVPLLLPAVPNAVGEVSFDSAETPKSNLNVSISRHLYRLDLTETGSSDDSSEEGDLLNLHEVGENETIDSRALYLDEFTLAPKPDADLHFLLLEAPLPTGGEVDSQSWGLSFGDLKPNFTEARAMSNGMGYAVPIETLNGKMKFHQLVRFSSSGKFLVPKAKLFNMYHPAQKAYEEGTMRREITVK